MAGGLLELALAAPVGVLYVTVGGVPVNEADREKGTDWEQVIEHVTVSDSPIVLPPSPTGTD